MSTTESTRKTRTPVPDPVQGEQVSLASGGSATSAKSHVFDVSSRGTRAAARARLQDHPLYRLATPSERQRLDAASPGWERSSGVWPRDEGAMVVPPVAERIRERQRVPPPSLMRRAWMFLAWAFARPETRGGQ